MNYSGILREPDRQERLTGLRVVFQMLDYIHQVSEGVANPSTAMEGIDICIGYVLSSGELRPIAFHIGMRELFTFSSMSIGGVSPWPVLPFLSWIERHTSDTFFKVIVCPREIGFDILVIVIRVLGSK
tara:strand:+ start:656 stop:1039 length:384 start_codon:yes stop_codon:yes gene_type:complete